MKKYIYYIIFLATSITYLTSCVDNNSDEEYQEYLEEYEAYAKQVFEQYLVDSTLISDYLLENDSTATFDDEYNLFYNIIEEGDESHPDINSAVYVNYKGTLLDGTVFDQTTDKPVLFNLSTLINGWKIGIPLIGTGGKITLYLPSYYGYGETEKDDIPANSVLIFEIELVDFYYY